MKQEIKTQWMKNLRSGEFIQGKLNLGYRDQFGVDHYCCWGVLCEQAARAGVIPPPTTGSSKTYRYGADSDIFYLPNEVVRWAELPDNGGPMSVNGDFARYNDSGQSFIHIAQMIDRDLI